MADEANDPGRSAVGGCSKMSIARDAGAVMISGHYGVGNLGDEAILAGLLEFLRTETELEPIVASFSPQETAALHEVRAIEPYPLPLGPRSLLRTATIRRAAREYLTVLRGCSAFVLGGGGLFYDYPGALDRLKNGLGLYRGQTYRWLKETLVPLRVGLPLAWCLLGAGPIHSRFDRRLARALAARTRHLSVRDPQSARVLAEIGVPSERVAVGADPTLLLPPEPSSRARTLLSELQRWAGEHPLVAFAPRPWPLDGLEARLGEVLRWGEELGGRIVFLPMHRSPQLDDEGLARRLGERFLADFRVLPALRPGEVRWLLEHFHLLVGMRLHALILASAAGTPGIGLAYDPKIAAWLGRLDSPDATLTLDSWQEGVAHGVLTRHLEAAESLRAPLTEKVKALAETARTVLRAMVAGLLTSEDE